MCKFACIIHIACGDSKPFCKEGVFRFMSKVENTCPCERSGHNSGATRWTRNKSNYVSVNTEVCMRGKREVRTCKKAARSVYVWKQKKVSQCEVNVSQVLLLAYLLL